jgi:adenylate kinase family enzyme
MAPQFPILPIRSGCWHTGSNMIKGTRIAIIGNAGGGKTTLARIIGETLDIPITHVDSIQYQSGWLRTPTNECDQALIDVANGDRWIIDGFGSDALIQRRIQIADTVLFVDFPVWKHYWWAIKRQFAARKGQRRELPDNCPEFNFSYTWKLMRVMWLVHRQYTPWFRELVRSNQQSGNVIVLRQRAEIQALITGLQDAGL